MSNNADNLAYGFGKQFLVFLIVMNIGVLFALGWLYLKVDAKQKQLELRQTTMIRDSLIWRDSLSKSMMKKDTLKKDSLKLRVK
jgi:hypothetical protein